MKQSKRNFIEEYIEKIDVAINAYNDADPLFTDQERDNIFDLLIEIQNVFESDIPTIEGALHFRNATVLRDANSVSGMLKYYLINNEEERPQNTPVQDISNRDKIFISHRSVDKKFAEIIETFLTSCGVPADKIFCSSLPGNDIEEEISKEIKESLQQSIINIALPEINENCMLGFLNNEYKIRRLDNVDDVFSITDIIKPCFESFLVSDAKLNSKIQQLCSQYSQALDNRDIDSKTLYSDGKGYYYATVVEDRGLNNNYRCLRIDGLLPTGEPFKEDETHWLFFSKDRYTNLQVNDRVKFIPTKWPQDFRDFSDIQNTRNIYIGHLEIL